MPSHSSYSLNSPYGIAPRSLRLLHPSEIETPGEIRALLQRVCSEKIALWRGLNRRIVPETARIDQLDAEGISLRTKNFERGSAVEIFLNFIIDDRPYFFSATLLQQDRNGRLRVSIPPIIHLSERRDRSRHQLVPGRRTRALVARVGESEAIGEVIDWSPEGLGLLIPDSAAPSPGASIVVRLLDGARAGDELRAEVRNRMAVHGRNGWTRIGLDTSAAPRGEPVCSLSHEVLLPPSGRARVLERWNLLAAAARVATGRAFAPVLRRSQDSPPIEIIEYETRQRERIRAIIDSWGPTKGGTAVVIPPAWGRTKETLMPLAACIVAAFERAGEPVVVVRFDGVRKRGESHNDPACRAPGKDHHHFTFSQGVIDIQATLDFLEQGERFQPSKTILVSFSAAALEARRAVAGDPRIQGWISVVGAPDLQSMMRVISGGVDYVAGVERGVRFGLQEILGVEVDIDHAGIDAAKSGLAYLEDARRDLASITVPITWISGRYDAWMNASRVRDILSRGQTAKRRFIEVPTGHMLKTSREALETFRLIAGEVTRIALGRALDPVLPSLAELERRRVAERRRLPKQQGDVRQFWRDYLLGGEAGLGIELMTNITPYDELMEEQVRSLHLRPGDTVVDLGSGTGAFPLHIARYGSHPIPIRIVELDYVRAALRRAQGRLLANPAEAIPAVAFVECDLDRGRVGGTIPLATESVDAVLASLFISYVSDPAAALSEIFRVLRPRGRLVLSSLRPDADMSKLYVEGMEELRAGRARERFGTESEKLLEQAGRTYLNEAARLLDLEEKGVFRFWDIPELVRLARRAGFRRVKTRRAMGTPPQAVVLAAERW